MKYTQREQNFAKTYKIAPGAALDRALARMRREAARQKDPKGVSVNTAAPVAKGRTRSADNFAPNVAAAVKAIKLPKERNSDKFGENLKNIISKIDIPTLPPREKKARSQRQKREHAAAVDRAIAQRSKAQKGSRSRNNAV